MTQCIRIPTIGIPLKTIVPSVVPFTPTQAKQCATFKNWLTSLSLCNVLIQGYGRPTGGYTTVIMLDCASLR